MASHCSASRKESPAVYYDSTSASTLICIKGLGDEKGRLAMALLSRLRQTVGTLLVEAGFNLDTVRRWLGQKTLAMAIHYSETADTSKQMRGVLEKVRPTREQNANIRDD